jgi:exosome complex RNA-binding protein Rrp42 (RNase PH superfamily)
MVNYGETIIIAALKCEVTEPEVAEPEKGFLSNTDYFE